MDIDWSEVVLKALLVILVILVIAIIAFGVDQIFGKETFAGNATVTEKHSGIVTTYLYVNKIWIPQTHPYWELIFDLNGQLHSSDVSEKCYLLLNIGDHVGIDKVTGLFSVGYYPQC